MKKINSVNDIDWTTWEPTERAVILYIKENDKVLLIHKKRGLGAGMINAPGGHIEEGETAEEAARRECEEEVGLIPEHLEHKGTLYFHFLDGLKMYGEVFIGTGYSGELTETDEADPFWCKISEIPLNKMWEDDFFWLPQVIRGKTMEGRFIFDKEKMISLDVRVTD